jgi:hypothetical protein
MKQNISFLYRNPMNIFQQHFVTGVYKNRTAASWQVNITCRLHESQITVYNFAINNPSCK